MASISISDLYRGEGPGEKYGGILNEVFHEIFPKGIPEGCSEQTWIEQLLAVKHTFLVAERMKKESDIVSELSEAASPFCCAKENCSGALLCISSGNQICSAEACRFGPSLNCAPPEPSKTKREVTK